MNAVTQTEFAAAQGWGRSYVTQLKHAGRLVMTANGLVDVEESLRRIRETADPNRDDVVARNAEARGQSPHAPPGGDPMADRIGNSYQAARAVKEKFLAMQAKLDYERAAGEALPRAMVVKVMIDATALIHTALENMPDRLAPLVTGVPDSETVRARIREEIEQLLHTVSRLFGALAEKSREGT